jgi:NADPH-dependent ferric siderophore reductase
MTTITEPAYVLFAVRVAVVTRLTPTFVRITFAGPELDRFAANGDDQRINLVLPGPNGEPLTPPAASAGDDGWYSYWLSLPDQERNPLRTYTVRQARPQLGEVDVDFVLHGDTGPASRWAATVAVGDAVQLVGPNARHAGSTRATGWNPPPGSPTLLIVADETALPAVASILEGLPATARGTVLIEVPLAGDALPLAAPAGVRVEWLARDVHPGAEVDRAGRHGRLLSARVREVAGVLLAGPHPAAVDERLDDEDELWDVPEPGDQPEAAPIYAWLAGEAGCIAGLRRHLVKELGLDRRSVAFMGYWRQ